MILSCLYQPGVYSQKMKHNVLTQLKYAIMAIALTAILVAVGIAVLFSIPIFLGIFIIIAFYVIIRILNEDV